MGCPSSPTSVELILGAHKRPADSPPPPALFWLHVTREAMMLLLVALHSCAGEPPTRPGGLLSANTEVTNKGSLALRGLEDWRLVRPALEKQGCFQCPLDTLTLSSFSHYRPPYPQGGFLQPSLAPRIKLLEQALVTSPS